MYESKLMLSREFLADAMGLPEEISITSIEYNVNRGIINVYLASGEEIPGVTFKVTEAAEKPVIAPGAWAKGGTNE